MRQDIAESGVVIGEGLIFYNRLDVFKKQFVLLKTDFKMSRYYQRPENALKKANGEFFVIFFYCS